MSTDEDVMTKITLNEIVFQRYGLKNKILKNVFNRPFKDNLKCICVGTNLH